MQIRPPLDDRYKESGVVVVVQCTKNATWQCFFIIIIIILANGDCWLLVAGSMRYEAVAGLYLFLVFYHDTSPSVSFDAIAGMRDRIRSTEYGRR